MDSILNRLTYNPRLDDDNVAKVPEVAGAHDKGKKNEENSWKRHNFVEEKSKIAFDILE